MPTPPATIATSRAPARAVETVAERPDDVESIAGIASSLSSRVRLPVTKKRRLASLPSLHRWRARLLPLARWAESP